MRQSPASPPLALGGDMSAAPRPEVVRGPEAEATIGAARLFAAPFAMSGAVAGLALTGAAALGLGVVTGS